MSSLKLFRSTGYSSLLYVTETRVAIHPAWVVAAISLWIGFACNVKLWRELALVGEGSGGLVRALALGAFIAADCAVVLSVLGWHKTLKPAATALLFLAALSAAAIWGQSLAVDATLFERRTSSWLLPPWTSLLRWEVTALVFALALLPTVWVWHTRIRRLSGPQQLNINVIGTLVSCAVLAVSGFLLSRGMF
jgi:glucan phosphoethanolaminetransferase (alkaline phosphatase superfamily)